MMQDITNTIPVLTGTPLAGSSSPGVEVTLGFRGAFGCTIGEYVSALRVRELARRLREEATPLARLAAELGFYDQPHLTRRFRGAYRLTPLAYRTVHRPN